MVNWYKQLVTAITITALLETGAVANAVSDVEQAVLIPGATVFKPINPLYPIVAKTYPVIGIHFHDDADPQVVDYSQDALDSDRAILDGVEQATAAVRPTAKS